MQVRHATALTLPPGALFLEAVAERLESRAPFHALDHQVEERVSHDAARSCRSGALR